MIFVTAADLRDPVALLARIAAALRGVSVQESGPSERGDPAKRAHSRNRPERGLEPAVALEAAVEQDAGESR